MVKYKISDALNRGIALLNENSIENGALDGRLLLCEVLGCDSLYLTVHREDEITEDSAKRYFEFIERRCHNEPLSYITGKKEFMSLDFYVNPAVLIPRPDTEILVERALKELFHMENPVVIDMCTGSGAIAVSVAKYLEGSKVLGIDISMEALATARRNAEENNVSVSFVSYDIRTPYQGIMADAVVSNPPYIPTGDVDGLESNVTDFEPHLALDGGNDGLDFYRAIVGNISSCLKRGGLLAFEVGMGQADDVRQIMNPSFANISTDCDLAGITRVVYGYLK